MSESVVIDTPYTLGPDATATSSKEAFVAEWNPLAQKLSLQTYTIGDI